MSDFETFSKTQCETCDLRIYTACKHCIDCTHKQKAAYEAGFRAASDKAATLSQRAMFDAGYTRGRKAGLKRLQR